MHKQNDDFSASACGLLEIPLALFSIGTVSYHMCLVLSLAAGHIVYPFLFISALYFYLNAPRLSQTIKHTSIIDCQFIGIILSFGIVLGLILLMVSRPDADDVQFLYLPLLQLNDLTLPFLTTNEFHDIKQLPRSSAKSVEFYPLAVALLSAFLNIDPLHGYQNVSMFLATLGLILVYAVCYRELKLSRKATLLAVIFAVLFLFIDGNLHRSFGNVSLVRLWQGKTIMWTVIVPLSMIATYRYIKAPSTSRYVFLVVCAVSALGLSGTGLFLVPATILATSLACFLLRGARRQDINSCVLVNTCSSYNILILAGMWLEILPTYPLKVLFTNWGATWFENLALVIPNAETLIRNTVLLLLVPIFALNSPQRKFIPLVVFAVVVLYLNPITGPTVFSTITGGSYWRFVYILPVPLAAGLLGVLIAKILKNRFRDRLALCVALIASASIAIAYEGSVLTPPKGLAPVWSKKMTDYRFPPNELESSKIIASRLKNADHLLAPQGIIHIVPLLKPTISLEAARGFDTQFVFANAGLKEEGIRRVQAQQLVTNCKINSVSQHALTTSVSNGLSAIVTSKCKSELQVDLDRLIQSLGSWQRVDARNGYTLYLRADK